MSVSEINVAENNVQEKKKLRMNAPEGLAFNYYDMLNVVAGASELVLEFGNVDRSKAGTEPTMNVMHRAVLSLPAAFQLQSGLTKTLQLLHEKMEEIQKKQMERKNADSTSDN